MFLGVGSLKSKNTDLGKQRQFFIFCLWCLFVFFTSVAWAQDAVVEEKTISEIKTVAPDDGSKKTKFVERSDDELLIVALTNNGYTLEEGLEAYMPAQGGVGYMLLPFKKLTEILHFSIEVSMDDGLANGWFITEENSFSLNLADKKAVVKGKSYPFGDKIVEVHYDDIYIDETLIEEWFGLDFELDFSSLTVDLTSKSELPFLSEQARKKRGEIFANGKNKEQQKLEDKPVVKLPYKIYSPHSYVVQTGETISSSDGEFSSSTSLNVQGFGDLLGFGSNYTVNLENSDNKSLDLTDADITFTKKDPEKKLLGKLHAGEISFGDINFSTIPLWQGQGRGRGVSISSNSDTSVVSTANAADFVLDGVGPVNWDVELYRNGIFAGFQTVGSDGRYSFENLDLGDGYNSFEIVMYGPEGQKQTETRMIVKGPSMLKEGELVYNFELGQPNYSFLPISSDTSDDSGFTMNFQTAYGVNEFLTVSGGMASTPDADNNSKTVIPLGINTSFKGMNVSYQFMAGDNSENAHEFMARTKVKDFVLSGNYRINNGFDEDDNDLSREMGFAVSKTFKFVSTGFDIKRKEYLDGGMEDTIANRLSMNFAGINFSHTLTAIVNDDGVEKDHTLEGEILLAKNLGPYRIRSEIAYEPDSEGNKIKTSKLSVNRDFSHDLTMGLTGEYSFDTRVTTLGARISKNMDPFALDLNLNADSEDSYTIGVRARVAMVPKIEEVRKTDSEGKTQIWNSVTAYGLDSPEAATRSKITLRSFVDINSNYKYDASDTPLEGIRFTASRGGAAGTSDKSGFAILKNLPEAAVTVAVDPSTINDIYIKPFNNDMVVIPRVGSMFVIDFPFEQIGEIEGTVYFKDEKGELQPLKDAEIALWNAVNNELIAHETSQYDGYFLFGEVPLNKYILKAKIETPELGEQEIATDVNIDSQEPVAVGVQLIFDQ